MNFNNTFIILMEWDSKKYRKHKVVDKYCDLCIEEKAVIASNNNSDKLHNQRSEILNVCWHAW